MCACARGADSRPRRVAGTAASGAGRQSVERGCVGADRLSVAIPGEPCEWCKGPIPDYMRLDAKHCGKLCRQASSRFGLAVSRTVPAPAPVSGPSDASRLSPTPAGATRRRPARREVLDDASRRDRAARPMRFAYADPPYPGNAGYYPEQAEVDHEVLVEWLVADFRDGWALSTSAAALQRVLSLCPAGVRVSCSTTRTSSRGSLQPSIPRADAPTPTSASCLTEALTRSGPL